MAHERAHDVHLGVADAGVAAAAVDLFQNDRRLGDRRAAAAVLLGDQRGEEAGRGHGVDELDGVGAVGVEPLPVGAGEAGAELADAAAEFGEVGGCVDFNLGGDMGECWVVSVGPMGYINRFMRWRNCYSNSGLDSRS